MDIQTQPQQPQDKRNAAQKIQDLEQAMGAAFQDLNTFARDITLIKDAIKLLGNKVDAVTKVIARNLPVNDANISAIMTENNVEELKSRVDNFLANGVITVTEAVTEQSFIVGVEEDKDGTVVNPRAQLGVSALQDLAVRGAFIGKKAGDLIVFGEGKLNFRLSEVYEIVDKTAPKGPVEAPVEVAEATPAPVEASAPQAEVAPEVAAQVAPEATTADSSVGTPSN